MVSKTTVSFLINGLSVNKYYKLSRLSSVYVQNVRSTLRSNGCSFLTEPFLLVIHYEVSKSLSTHIFFLFIHFFTFSSYYLSVYN